MGAIFHINRGSVHYRTRMELRTKETGDCWSTTYCGHTTSLTSTITLVTLGFVEMPFRWWSWLTNGEVLCVFEWRGFILVVCLGSWSFRRNCSRQLRYLYRRRKNIRKLICLSFWQCFKTNEHWLLSHRQVQQFHFSYMIREGITNIYSTKD